MLHTLSEEETMHNRVRFADPTWEQERFWSQTNCRGRRRA